MITVHHIILDDDDKEKAEKCAADAGMPLEEWIQYAVDYAVIEELTPTDRIR